MKKTLVNSFAIGCDEAGPVPTIGQIVGKPPQMNLPKPLSSHFGKVQIRQNEIHFHAGMPSRGISMLLEQASQCGEVFGSLKRVEIIGSLA
jgi:hypothetical protein